MEEDTSAKVSREKKWLCTHHVGSGRKEERGILGSVNTARLAPWLRGFLYTDLESDFKPVNFSSCFLETVTRLTQGQLQFYCERLFDRPNAMCQMRIIFNCK